MQHSFVFSDQFNRHTTFIQLEGVLWLEQLCGLKCSLDGSRDDPGRKIGMMVLQNRAVHWRGSDFRLLYCRKDGDSFESEWTAGDNGLHWHSHWTLHTAAGIWSRQDRIMNLGAGSFPIQSALLCFPLASSPLECYAQSSSWAHESQGSWMEVPAGGLTLRSQAGRTNQGASPYLFLRPKGTAPGIAFHILPRGNWVIHLQLSNIPGQPQSSLGVVELGLSDDRLELDLVPGMDFRLPELLIQAVLSSQPESGAPLLHRYALERFFNTAPSVRQPGLKASAPLVYNTWFDASEFLEIGRMRDQLVAAREIGCEVFVVDAGWYGNGNGPWDQQIGDWSEKRGAAFDGHMAEFAEEVRTAGLGFGLWMEPERFSASSPIVRTSPGWFLPGRWGFLYPDLSKRQVYDYLTGEISRLVETYQLAWMKVDFNLEMGDAADGLAGYYQEWYKMLDELRRRFPETFFEGCASGGMRLDLNTLAHFDGHFLSDTVNPVDILRISQGAFLRVPPGRLTRWAVLRPAGRRIPRYGQPPGQALERVITPGGSNWEDSVIADVDFICRAALPGMFGYSGDLAGLSVETRARLRYHSAFYQRWREFLAGCFCHLLTPIRNLEDRDGWIALQLQNPHEQETSQILVYRLNDGIHQKRIQLRGLDPEHFYTVTNEDTPNEPPLIFSGRELTSIGLPVELPSKFSAGVYILQPKPG